MYETINEKVEVLAHFSTDGIIPIYFIWKSKNHSIQTILSNKKLISSKNTEWEIIATTEDAETYKLIFQSWHATWMLAEVYREFSFAVTTVNEEIAAYCFGGWNFE